MKLSNRERQVLRVVAKYLSRGTTSREISLELMSTGIEAVPQGVSQTASSLWRKGLIHRDKLPKMLVYTITARGLDEANG